MITVFSFGAGQESMYLLHRLIFDPVFRAAHVIGRLIVVGSDTGEEHPHTYAVVEYARALCKEHGIEFHWLTPDMGYHSTTWQSLSGQYTRNNTIGSAAFQQSCTDNLKIKVVDRFVEAKIKETYGYTGKRKQAYYQYHKEHGQIRLILGFAKGEERRTSKGNTQDPVWKRKTVQRHFPLIVDGIDRAGCIAYNTQHIPFPVFPSNCMICFYQSDQEVLWLHRNYPEVFAAWVRMEAAKLAANTDKPKNLAIYGKIDLPAKLAKAEALYGHWSNEELNDYKFSHGHCMKSKF